MKLSEIFAKLGIKVDDEVDLGQQAAGNPETAQLIGLVNTLLAYSEGFYNNETGAFDLSKISDATLKGALEDYTAKQAAKETQRIIDAAYETELAKHNLAIDKEVFRKVIDLSGVTVKDGKAAGIEEAFNALNDTGVYKAQPANPLNSGFKPAENPAACNGNIMSFADALNEAAAAATN